MFLKDVFLKDVFLKDVFLKEQTDLEFLIFMCLI